IAMAILAFMTIYASQTIRQGALTKVKIQSEIDRSIAVKDALNAISRDVKMAFHYRDPNIELINRAEQERRKKPTTPPKSPPNNPPGQPPTQPPATPPSTPPAAGPALPPSKPRTEVILTHFIGERNFIHFTSLSNVRSIEDSPVSRQAEVGYFLRR